MLLSLLAACSIDPLPVASGSIYAESQSPSALNPAQIAAISHWIETHRIGWLPQTLVAIPTMPVVERRHRDGETSSLYIYCRERAVLSQQCNPRKAVYTDLHQPFTDRDFQELAIAVGC